MQCTHFQGTALSHGPRRWIPHVHRCRVSYVKRPPLQHVAPCSRPSAASANLFRDRHGSTLAAAGDSVASTAVRNDTAARHWTQQELLDFGATFVKHWFTGIAKGPAAVHPSLTDMLDTDVVLMGDSVRIKHDSQGLPEVLAELERSHLEYPHSQHQPILYAASPSSQRAYALVEGRYQDVGALPGHPATFRISRVHVIMGMEVRQGKVVRLWLRRQMTEEDKDELLRDPVHCYPIPFPKENVQLASAGERERAGSKMVQAVKAWWGSWSESAGNGVPAAAAAAEVLSSPAAPAAASAGPEPSSPAAPPSSPAAADSGWAPGSAAAAASTPPDESPGSAPSRRSSLPMPESSKLLATEFKMWDAYGLYSHMRAKGRRYLSRGGAVRFMRQLAHQYNMDIQVLDVAVAEGSLCCFTHWRATLRSKWADGGQAGGGLDQAGGAQGAGSEVVTIPDPEVVGAAAAGKAIADALRKSRAAAQQQGPSSSSSGEAAVQIAAAAAGAVLASTAAPATSSSAAGPAGAADRDGSYVVEGMEVDVFTDGLMVHDIWLFRGPLEWEQRLFLSSAGQVAAAEQAAAAEAEERLLEERREQREQQLQELLTWMTTYQQQWSDRIQHVQKALQRHRNLFDRGASEGEAGEVLNSPVEIASGAEGEPSSQKVEGQDNRGPVAGTASGGGPDAKGSNGA